MSKEYKTEIFRNLSGRIMIAFVEWSYQSGKTPRRFQVHQLPFKDNMIEHLIQWSAEWADTGKVPRIIYHWPGLND